MLIGRSRSGEKRFFEDYETERVENNINEVGDIK